MTALTPLGQQRADTACVHQAARALRAGCRPEQVVAFLAAYCGLPMVDRYYVGLRRGWEITNQVREKAHLERMAEARARLSRRRWWSR